MSENMYAKIGVAFVVVFFFGAFIGSHFFPVLSEEKVEWSKWTCSSDDVCLRVKSSDDKRFFLIDLMPEDSAFKYSIGELDKASETSPYCIKFEGFPFCAPCDARFLEEGDCSNVECEYYSNKMCPDDSNTIKTYTIDLNNDKFVPAPLLEIDSGWSG